MGRARRINPFGNIRRMFKPSLKEALTNGVSNVPQKNKRKVSFVFIR